MSKYIIPVILIIAFIIIAVLFFPSSDEKRIREIIHECEIALNDKNIQPIIDYLDDGFIVPEYNLDINDIRDDNFFTKTLRNFDNLDVRKISVEVEENTANVNMIVRIINSQVKYELPFEVKAELKKQDENWFFK
ncbi:MAG: hypothetical protein K8S87_01025, partial [Planctomycetes bacterium]|nr:hypothetical protein [Planctomycetota bacterium]